MVISSRKEELYRVSQTIHDSVNLCVQPDSGAAICLIRVSPTIGASVYLDAGGIHAQVFRVRILRQYVKHNFQGTVVPLLGESGIH